jgi:hypothetical protein
MRSFNMSNIGKAEPVYTNQEKIVSLLLQTNALSYSTALDLSNKIIDIMRENNDTSKN